MPRNPLPHDEAQHGPPVRLWRLSELRQLEPPRQLVRGLLAEEGLAIIFGRPESAKTFIALDLALCIAAGQPWHGHGVSSGHVIYVIGESERSFRLRIDAWCQARSVGVEHAVEDRLRIIEDPLAFLAGGFAETVKYLMSRRIAVRLIVIDTLARCFPDADENNTAHMNAVIARCDTLRRVLNTAVIVVHHCTKGGHVERGSGALRAAADTMLRAERHGNVFKLSCSKQKESVHAPPMVFRLDRIVLGTGDDGSELSSCRLSATRDSAAGPAEVDKRASARERILHALREAAKNGPTSAARIRRIAEMPKATFSRHLRDLVRAGDVRPTGKSRATRYEVVTRNDAAQNGGRGT